MEIVKAQEKNINQILSIYNHARAFMRQTGNLVQWDDNYPNREIIENDISMGRSYIVKEQDNILGVMMYHVGNDPTYNVIDGAWLNDEPYGVIHRIAVKSHRQGVAQFMLDWAMKQCRNCRIDTHSDNSVMRKFLLKNGFVETGVILLENGDPRDAFHKVI